MGDLEWSGESLMLTPPGHAEVPGAVAASMAERRRRRTRRIDRDALDRGTESTPLERAHQLGMLWEAGREQSVQLAQQYRVLAACAAAGAPGSDEAQQAEAEVLQVCVALRCTRRQAVSFIEAAFHATDLLPACLERLTAGEFPARWFEKLVQRTEDLDDEAVLFVDQALAASDLEVTPESFDRRLNHLVTVAASRSEIPAHATPEGRRRVVLDPPRPGGVGCLRILGPIPEILDLSRRLDAAAHAVKDAQVQALMDGTPIPCDPGGEIERTFDLPSITALRYELLRGALLDTAGVRVPEPRFRMTVTVPALSLMGESDAPGMLDGLTPIPAQMARELAARESTWYRVLTDPVNGRFLPLPATSYRPSPRMLEHLRLRHPVCTVPGCTRPTVAMTECDHIVEFDHEDPSAGGPTELMNLHLLCRQHHRMKTAGLLDPIRDEGAGRTWWELDETIMTFQEDARDLATEQVVQEMQAAWDTHLAAAQARRETAERLRNLGIDGLSPGDTVRGPDGTDDWIIGDDGIPHPPPERPPF